MAWRRTNYNFDLWIQRKTSVSDLTSNMFLLFSLFCCDCSLWLQKSAVFVLSWGVKWSLVQNNPWSLSSLSVYGRLVSYFVIYFSFGEEFQLWDFFSKSFQPERSAGLISLCLHHWTDDSWGRTSHEKLLMSTSLSKNVLNFLPIWLTCAWKLEM